ncbi:MAG: RNA methyltransferase [Candidatus Asgardarchaeia archaeon]
MGELELSVALIEPEVAGNIGAVARVMANFNFKNLIIVNPKVPIGDVEFARAKGGWRVLRDATIIDNLKDLKRPSLLVATSARLARDYDVRRIPIKPEQLADLLSRISGDVVIMFGRESYGLTNEEIDMADILVNIPASKDYPVLNLSHAVAIILYEVWKKIPGGKVEIRVASSEQKNLLIECFNEVVSKIGLPDFKERIAIRCFKNLIGRATISSREATTLIGVTRKILRRMGKNTDQDDLHL